MGLFNKKKKRAANLVETGAKGIGTVIAVADTGMTINENPRVKLTVRIEPLDGAPTFDALKTTTVSRVAIPRQGEKYPVWYDRQNPEEWAYGTISDDAGRASMRNLFGSAAEDFTGM